MLMLIIEMYFSNLKKQANNQQDTENKETCEKFKIIRDYITHH